MIDIDTIENTSIRIYSKNPSLIPKEKFPRFPTTVIDDFFQEPLMWRNLALQQEYKPAFNTTFPGQRSKLLAEIDEDIFGTFCERLLPFFTSCTMDFIIVMQVFSSVDKTFIKGWVHDDDPITLL